ncbi:hypothetical protein ACS0TY_035622 [Phlomoides rotata]
MDNEGKRQDWPQICWCDGGRMKLFQVSAQTINNGSNFYKCHRDFKHPQSFIWCDEWHQDDFSETLPAFLQFPQQLPKKSPTQQASSSSCAFTPKDAAMQSTCKCDIEVDSSFYFRSHSLEPNIEDNPLARYGIF